MALRGISLFPGMLLSFDVERPASLGALDAAMDADQSVYLVAQRDAAVEQPEQSDLYTIGTVGRVRQILRMPDTGSAKAALEGVIENELGIPAERQMWM